MLYPYVDYVIPSWKRITYYMWSHRHILCVKQCGQDVTNCPLKPLWETVFKTWPSTIFKTSCTPTAEISLSLQIIPISYSQDMLLLLSMPFFQLHLLKIWKFYLTCLFFSVSLVKFRGNDVELELSLVLVFVDCIYSCSATTVMQ